MQWKGDSRGRRGRRRRQNDGVYIALHRSDCSPTAGKN